MVKLSPSRPCLSPSLERLSIPKFNFLWLPVACWLFGLTKTLTFITLLQFHPRLIRKQFSILNLRFSIRPQLYAYFNARGYFLVIALDELNQSRMRPRRPMTTLVCRLPPYFWNDSENGFWNLTFKDIWFGPHFVQAQLFNIRHGIRPLS